MPGPLKFLVVGSGAREHAITRALHRSSVSGREIYCFGSTVNPGIKSLCHGYGVGKINDPTAVVLFAKEKGAEAAIIGPEAPLATGVADALWAAGVPCVGPKKALAQLETSKAFTRQLCSDYKIPGQPKFKKFASAEGVRAYIDSLAREGASYVVKADGLYGGKGVKVAGEHLKDTDEAVAYCEDIVKGKDTFVIEEKFVGQEFSLISFCDGDHLAHMPPVQDHKRAHVGDTGPNTGGMGSYSDADHLLPFLKPSDIAEAVKITEHTARALRNKFSEGYKGVMYGGFMATANGVKLIEYNARFGDPECMNLLALLKSDFVVILQNLLQGTLRQDHCIFANKASVCKYAVPDGYPDKSVKGMPVDITGCVDQESVYLAAVDEKDGKLIETGSRTFAVLGVADTLAEAERIAEAEINRIKGPVFHRPDIGTAALLQKRIDMMKDIRGDANDEVLRIGVLGSTRGTSLQPVLDLIAAKKLRARVEIVVSNRKEAPILERATRHNVKSVYLPCKKGEPRDEYDAKVTQVLEEAGVDLVILVGFMRILSSSFVQRWAWRVLNVHPSLLPLFGGKMNLDVHEEVLASGLAKTGCTVHFVDEGVDTGAHAVQLELAIGQGETATGLKDRVQGLEGVAYPMAIYMFQCGFLRHLSPSAGPALTQGKAQGMTYKDAGVDIDAGNALVDQIKPLAKSTNRPGVMGGLGGFGGLFDLKAAGYDDPVLVSGTDGVGTKLKIAQTVGQHDTIGIDLVAMCVNDILAQGAEPLFFLDYFATGKLSVPQARDVVAGVAEGCRQANCALIGGETAEMPGLYSHGDYDVAGFTVGAVDRARMLPRIDDIAVGDTLIGIASSGVHSNGYSLVRLIMDKCGVSYTSTAPFDTSKTIGEALLAPTRIYVRSCMPLIKSGRVKALAHITGGGLTENIPRVLKPGIGVRMDANSWEFHPLLRFLSNLGKLTAPEVARTFNCGLGAVLIVDKAHATEMVESLRGAGEKAWVVGSVTEDAGSTVVVDNGAEAWGLGN